MRGTYVGFIVAVHVRKAFTKRFQNGSSKEIPDTPILLLAQAYDEPPTRVRLSEAQASELSNPAFQFEQVQITGEVVRDEGGFGQFVDCATYAPLAAASK